MNINVSRQSMAMPVAPLRVPSGRVQMAPVVRQAPVPQLVNSREVNALISHSRGTMGGPALKPPPGFLIPEDIMAMRAGKSSGKKMSTTQKGLFYGIGGALKMALDATSGVI